MLKARLFQQRQYGCGFSIRGAEDTFPLPVIADCFLFI